MSFNKKEEEIIRWSLENGKTPQETKDAVMRFRTTGSPRIGVTPEATVEEPGVLERVGGVITRRGERVQEAITGEEEFTGRTPVRRGVEAFAEVAGAPLEVATQLLPETARKGLSKAGEFIGTQFKKLTDLIGSTPQLQQFVTENPEAAKVIEEIAGTGAAVGQVAGEALIAGGVTKVLQKAAQAPSQVLSKANEALAGIKAPGTAGIKEAASKALDPNDIMKRVARTTQVRQAKFEKLAGENVGEYLVKRGIFGDIDSISQQLFKRFQQSKGVADTEFAKLQGNFKTPPLGNALKQLLEREQRISSPGALSKDLERVRALTKKHNGSGLTMSEINEVKRLFEKNVKLDFIKENLPDKVAQANTLDSSIRNWQRNKAEELGFTNIKEINRETMLAKTLLDDLGAKYGGADALNKITLTDWIILAGGDPTAVGAFITKKALSSKKVMAKVAEKLAPEPTVPVPTAVITEPTVSGYLEFLKSIEGRTKQ